MAQAVAAGSTYSSFRLLSSGDLIPKGSSAKFHSTSFRPSLPHPPLRKLRSVCNATNNYYSSSSSMRSEGFWSPESIVSSGIWSIRNDLEVPSSLYSGTYAQGGQGPSPMMQERFQSVITQLFQYRIIRCGGAVDDDMANLIVAQLLYLDAADPNRDIIMYINSPGGSVTAGMAIFDTMRHIRPDVSTVCVGLAARQTHIGCAHDTCAVKAGRIASIQGLHSVGIAQ